MLLHKCVHTARSLRSQCFFMVDKESLFVEWLKEWDCKLGQESKYFLMLVDNCVVNDVKNTTLRNFLQKNPTSILLPCNLVIIKTAKAYLHKEMAHTVLHQIDEGSRDTAADIAEKGSLLG
ncbi:hypothetical protein DPEC_G00043450 [Dallia pectoralis]|uniref:Uncharacterized protein n=1 Tax=Dallia pectoralis TaxID=75939 RepID=A0ACC2H9K8_DALPE|nr:hypothetical protein DPEC_G00043450 [Dallia pectoralis]